LPMIARKVGYPDVPQVNVSSPDQPFGLDAVYDPGIEAKVRSIYQRDYLKFGFGPWRNQAA